MGCGSSTDTAVVQWRPEQVNDDQDETGSKHGSRGDSAISKGTTDSGVVMENREAPALPGAVPRKLPPLTFVRESEADSVTQDAGLGLLQQESRMQKRPKSSEILEELMNQVIIPVGQIRERGSGSGEAYDIMLDDREGVRQRRPARLESLKAKKVPPSREEIEEKMRLTEERRKLREDKLKTRLRTKSARVRGPAPTSSTKEDEDAAITLVEPLQSPLTPDLTPGPLLYSQIIREAAEGGECVREAGGDNRENKEEVTTAGKKEGMEEGGERGDNKEGGRGGAERISEDGDGEQEEEEELTQVEELTAGQLLSASGELESDSSFQCLEDKEALF